MDLLNLPLPNPRQQNQAPKPSVVVVDFLNRYDQRNKATLIKLKSTLPIFIELLK
ncbi:hypothetical protein [Methylomonas albis]|nr:hypothetical protein [Methylomonas albis]